MATAGVPIKYSGGSCYAMCQDTFSFFNPSIGHCWKGCDYAQGRVNDSKGHEKANNMCKRYTSEVMWTEKGELDNLEDLRVYADMFPVTPDNIYRACLAGVRRQRY